MALARVVLHAFFVFLAHHSDKGLVCAMRCKRYKIPQASEVQALKVAVVPTKLSDKGSLDDWEVPGAARACFREPIEEGEVQERVVVPVSILMKAKDDLEAAETKKTKYLKSTGYEELTAKQKGIVEAMLADAKDRFLQRLGLQALSREEALLVHFYFIGHGDFGGISLVRKRQGWDVQDFLDKVVKPLVALLPGKRLRLHLRSCHTFNYEFVQVAGPEIETLRQNGIDITLDGFDKAFSPAGFPHTDFYTGGSRAEVVSSRIEEFMQKQFKTCFGTWVDAEKKWTGALSRSLAQRVNNDEEMRGQCRALSEQLEGQLQLWLNETSGGPDNSVTKQVTHPVFRTLPEKAEAELPDAEIEGHGNTTIHYSPEEVQAFRVAIVPSKLGEGCLSDWRVSAGARAALMEEVPEVATGGGAVMPMSSLMKARIHLGNATTKGLKDIRDNFIDTIGLDLSKSTVATPEAVHFYFIGDSIYDQISQGSSNFFRDIVRLLPGKQLRLHLRSSSPMGTDALAAVASKIQALQNEGIDITLDVYLDGVIPAGFPTTEFYKAFEDVEAADHFSFTPEQFKTCFGKFVDAESEQNWSGELSRKFGRNLVSGYDLVKSCKPLQSQMKRQVTLWMDGSGVRDRKVDTSMRIVIP